MFYDVDRDSSEFVDVVHLRRAARREPVADVGPADGRCVMEDMGDDDGTGRDPLVERVAVLKGCSVLFTLGLQRPCRCARP